MEPRAHRLLRAGSLPLLHAAQGAAPAAARSHRAVQGVRCATAARRGQRDVRRLVGALTARAVRRAYTAVPGQERRPGSYHLRGENDRAETAGAPRASRSSHCPARRMHAACTPHARRMHAARTRHALGTHAARPRHARCTPAARTLHARCRHISRWRRATWWLCATAWRPRGYSIGPSSSQCSSACAIALSGLTWCVMICRLETRHTRHTPLHPPPSPPSPPSTTPRSTALHPGPHLPPRELRPRVPLRLPAQLPHQRPFHAGHRERRQGPARRALPRTLLPLQPPPRAAPTHLARQCTLQQGAARRARRGR